MSTPGCDCWNIYKYGKKPNDSISNTVISGAAFYSGKAFNQPLM